MLDTNKINTLEQKVDYYNKTLTECLQECVPLKTKQQKTSTKQPWFGDNIKCKIQIRRIKEHQCKKNPLNITTWHFTTTQEYHQNSTEYSLQLATTGKQK